MSVIPHLLRDLLLTISSLLKMVGMTGFEPAAPTSRTWCATKLRYIPVPKARHYIGYSLPFTIFVKKVLQKNCIIQVLVNLFGFRTARHHISCWCAYQSFAKKVLQKTVSFKFNQTDFLLNSDLNNYSIFNLQTFRKIHSITNHYLYQVKK